jgi:DNA-binding NtrC family response regulator
MTDTLMLADARVARVAHGAAELVGRSPAITRAQEFVRRAAALDSGVLISGETGTALEPIARDLHSKSRHSGGAYVIVECGAADAARLDRFLFGAGTVDAATDLETVTIDSRVAAARGGVLFLQDVTELPAGAQARLARIARDGEVRIDGAPVETGFRLIGSATPGIDAEVEAHRFRVDLFRRLTATRIDVPSLRERQEDVPALAQRLLDDVCAQRLAAGRTFAASTLALIGALTWPGNLMELREAIERVVEGTCDEVIQIEHMLPSLRLQRASDVFAPTGSLREARLRFERDYIAAVLQHHGWHMANAATTLGIQRPNLYRKARQLGIPLTGASE